MEVDAPYYRVSEKSLGKKGIRGVSRGEGGGRSSVRASCGIGSSKAGQKLYKHCA